VEQVKSGQLFNGRQANTEDPGMRPERRDAAAAEMYELLRHLVRRLVDEEDEAEPARRSTPGLILDVEVDGVRCVLVRRRSEASGTQAQLSPREREIVEMVARGLPNKAIAGVLEISCWTVSTHLRRVFSKLGVSSRASMVARLLGQELLVTDAAASRAGPLAGCPPRARP
jgi:DNA-binding CsgD family transcriptional regulator